MNSDRLTKRIFYNFDEKLETNIRWFVGVKKDLVKMNKAEEGLIYGAGVIFGRRLRSLRVLR